jgi:ABC-type multidrug transport system fused ATPase/permease subunit
VAADHVSLRIPARATVGFVGANGSGKSTVVDLLAGLLVPEAGQISVDGVALEDGNRAGWQSRIAYVPQNICLLNASIEQNIALGVPSQAVDRQRLLAAVHLARLDDCIASLPGGFDYVVGERGLRLSGGQRQRLGIARALYTDASVLILDEATNALDGLTEQELLATFARLQGRYTIILVAHQPGTMRICDMLFEFEQGKVVASGTYAELMHDSVTFRHLVRHPNRDEQPALTI